MTRDERIAAYLAWITWMLANKRHMPKEECEKRWP